MIYPERRCVRVGASAAYAFLRRDTREVSEMAENPGSGSRRETQTMREGCDDSLRRMKVSKQIGVSSIGQVQPWEVITFLT